MSSVHLSPYAGSWYPSDRDELQSLLAARFAESERRTGPFLPDSLAFVTPHAGPQYSGTVAASAYRALGRSRPEHIVVLAFPHRGAFTGIGVPDVSAISTPLGAVPLDTAFGGFRRVPESQLCDHSLEIQLPFLQTVAAGARITPLYIGQLTPAERRQAASTLAGLWHPGMVFLASSDFTHYGDAFGYLPFPVDDTTERRLGDLDFEYIDAAGSLDAALFASTLDQRHATVCGRDPIALLLTILDLLDPDGIYQSLLDYQTSGALEGDFHHSVSYAALAYSRRDAFHLDDRDRAVLLDAAAATLRRLRAHGDRDPVPARGGSEALEARRGMFVSLHRDGELLGCLGNCSGREALSLQASELTLAAALDDPRFRPAAGVSGPIEIEISTLTPFRRIRDAARFCLRRHGASLGFHGRTGLLLPQVAADPAWTAPGFLEALSRKALAGPDAWRDPQARLHVFEAQVFSSTSA